MGHPEVSLSPLGSSGPLLFGMELRAALTSLSSAGAVPSGAPLRSPRLPRAVSTPALLTQHQGPWAPHPNLS